MIGLSRSQKELFNDLVGILPANTRQIAKALKHRQAYESHLRDRLFRLADRGLLEYGPGPRGSRVWSLSEIPEPETLVCEEIL